MKNQDDKSADIFIFPEADSIVLPREQETTIQSYRPPQLVIIGKANKLVQSYSYGKYSDGYSGYYWER